MAALPYDHSAHLSDAQLRDLYRLSLQLGPLRPLVEAPAAALGVCAAMAGATAGGLLGPWFTPAWLGLASEADPAALDYAELGERAYAAGGGVLLPEGALPLPPGPVVAALLGVNLAGGLVVLGGFGSDTALLASLDLVLAAAPLLAQSIARAAHFAEARQREEAHDQTVSLLAHDIRSPLVSAHASIEVTQRLLAGRDVPPSVFAALKTGLRSVRTAVELCNDMLEVKRLQAGQRIDRRFFNLTEMLDDVAELLAPLSAQGGATIRVRVEPAGLTGFGDARLLRRLLTNLATNALRFTPPAGQVELAAVADNDSVILSVSDTGSGVAVADRERIFEPFAQGSGERGRGVGLGLFFCRQATLAHGGAIWVEERPGGGSRFVVRLPAGV